MFISHKNLNLLFKFTFQILIQTTLMDFCYGPTEKTKLPNVTYEKKKKKKPLKNTKINKYYKIFYLT